VASLIYSVVLNWTFSLDLLHCLSNVFRRRFGVVSALAGNCTVVL
jgi:hypothetical protein